MEREAIIRVNQVKKYFKDTKAVNGVDLTIYRGEFVALLGPNGAGKTTLVEMIEGIQTPNQGDVRLFGKTWSKARQMLNKKIGISLQETRLIDKLTVGETLKLFVSFYGLPFSRVEEILTLINLLHKRKTFTVNLSGGQRQRLALGIALLNQPEILMLDEPTTGLDPAARRSIWEILLLLKEKHNTTLILTTHYMEEAEVLCDRIVFMHEGQVITQGSLDELLQQSNERQVIEFILKDATKISVFEEIQNKVELNWIEEKKKGKMIVKDLVSYLPYFFDFLKQRNIELESISCRQPTLEDLFLSLTGKRLSD